MSELPETAVKSFQERYQTGENQFVNWIHDKLPVRLSEAQKRILRAIANNKRVIVVGANGMGKSYAAACLSLAFLHSRRPSTVLATSGTYGKLKRTLCRPVQSIQEDEDLAHPLPGRYKHSPPRIDTGDPEWYFEASRPRDAGELEGTHNTHLLAITEEADKDTVSQSVIESLDSCLTNKNDRHLVIANPPKTENNIVHKLINSDGWETVRLATWDSRNVLVDTGQHDGAKIPGLLSLDEVINSWEDWNGEDWPGFEEAKNAHNERTDLDERWYRRRAGVKAPEASDKWRPFSISDVEAAYSRTVERNDIPQTAAIDVARSGDETVLSAKHGQTIEIHFAETGFNHVQQKRALQDELSILDGPETAVDAVGEGSGLADELNQRFNITRYSNGAKPREEREYYDCWAEALDKFGQFLQNGSIESEKLYEQAKVTAGVVTLHEKDLTSRGGGVIRATPKDEIKEQLGHSPDYLDSALMANWLDMTNSGKQINRRNARASMQKRQS